MCLPFKEALVIPVNERGDGVPRFPLNWRALLTGSRRCNAWGIDLMVVLAEKIDIIRFYRNNVPVCES